MVNNNTKCRGSRIIILLTTETLYNLICCYKQTTQPQILSREEEIDTQRTVQNQNNTREKANFNRQKNEELSLIDSPKYT